MDSLTVAQPLRSSSARSIRREILLRFGLVATVPLLTMGLIHGAILSHRNRIAAENELARVAQSVGQRVGAHLVQHRQAVVAFAGLLEKDRNVTPPHVELSMAVIHAAYPGFVTMLTADPTGRLISTHPALTAAGELVTAVSPSVADREYFRQPLATGEAYVSQAFRGRGFGTDPIVAISAPVRDQAGGISAVVEGSLNLADLAKLSTSGPTTKPMDLLVLDAERHVVYSNSPARFPALSVPVGSHFGHLVDSAATSASSVSEIAPTTEEPDRKLVARFDFSASADTPRWSVIVMQNTSVALAEIRAYWLRMALAAACAALVAFIISRRLAGQLTKPIEALASSIGAFSLGEAVPAQPPPAIGRIDETKRLWGGFFAMAARLERSYHQLAESQAELRYANTGLEAEVAQRTSELAAELELRRAAEDHLRQLALVAEHTSNIVVITDASGRIVWSNPAFTRVSGYAFSEVKGCKPGNFLQGPETNPATVAHMSNCLRAGRGFHVEIANYAKDGHRYWLEIDTQPVKAPDGRITNYVAIETDITARRQAEADIVASRDHLDLALEAANTCTWENDLVQNVLRLDARWSVMLGGPAEPTEYSSRMSLREVHPQDRPSAMRATRDCVERQTPQFRNEHRVRNHRGEWIWIQSTGRVVARDAAGCPTRLIGTNTDITARKHAETQLHQQKEFLATLQQTTLDLLARRELKDVFQTLIEHATRLLRAPIGELLLREGDDFVICAHTHDASFTGPLHVGRSEAPLTWRAHDTGRAVVLENYATAPERQLRHETLAACAVAVIPILLGDACVGVIALGRTEANDTFTADDLAHGTLLAQMAALVLHNAGIRESALREAAERTAALRESEARARALFDESPIIIALVSMPDGRIVEANAAALSAFGANREEALGRTSTELEIWAEPEERSRYLELLHTAGWVNGFEARLRRRSGETLTVLFSGRVISIGGRPYSLNSIQDISARKRSEAERDRSLALLQATLESTADGILVVNAGGHIESFNQIFAEMWHLPSAAPGETTDEAWMIPTILGQLVTPENFLVSLRDLFSGSDDEVFDTLHCRDGRIFERYSRPQFIANRPSGRVWSFRDVTDRRRAESALRESEERFRVLAEVSPVGIFNSDTAGRCKFVNRRWCELAGLTPQQALHDGWFFALHAEDRTRVMQTWAEAVARDGAWLDEFRFTKPDGTATWLVGQSRAQLHGDGRVAGYVGTITDISQLKRANEDRQKMERQVRQAQKIESLGTLAGGIAHDFNNILTGILGFADLARLSLDRTHRANECLDHVQRSGLRARELVRQILTFSRPSTTDRIPHRLHTEISEALQLLRSTLPAMVELERRIDPRTSPVLADATQVHQIVMNLCTNAWHALPPGGGCITVTLENQAVTRAEAAAHRDLVPGPYVLLSVADTGSGMSAETIEHIFEPFFTTKEIGKGTGLGLAVVHGVMKSHQGAIIVQSTLGVGTTFQLYFPALVLPEVSVAPIPVETIPRGHGEQILLVDDDEDSGFAIECIVTKLGYQVVRIPSPVRALEHFKVQPAGFALALVDLAMPAMPGDTLAINLLALRPDLPVVMVTGFAEPDREAAILASGVREVLRKPPELALLGRALARHLNAPRSLPAPAHVIFR